jgi:FkbH-like protein
MSNFLHTDLSWLPRAPANFKELCRAIAVEISEALPGDSSVSPGLRIRALASYALDENQLNRLAKVIIRCSGSCDSLKPLSPFRLGLLSNSTTDFIIPPLIASAARHGFALECVRSNYDQSVQEALSPDSAVNAARPDAVVIAIDYRALPLRCQPGSRSDADRAVESSLGYIESMRSGIRSHSQAVCIIQTLAPPPERLFGSLDRSLPGTPLNVIGRINEALAASVPQTGDILLDVAGLAEAVGLSEWHSPVQWNVARVPFSTTYLPLYADHVARVIASLRGKSRKCLVLDLDNTVWGGVVGDDGIEGIQIAQGDATGEAYRSVQQFALQLRERGIVLAVSSKNHDEVARLPFQKHPEMLLREEHVAVFQANWNDKATNIQAIADELSLGLDAMVLLDDNPVERGLVRQFLPQVAVPELPDDPALYVSTLAAAGYFESVTFSREDLLRAGYYQDNARRVSLQKQAGDVEAYLESLSMEITFQPFDSTGRSRIAQLINKSNQFNLTTRRYTENDVENMERDADCFTLQVRLSDSFGDNGMVSVVICRLAAADTWAFDTWLMSCRVLGRRVENKVLLEVMEHARRQGIRKLLGVYLPTGKNRLVEDHYNKLGFIRIGCDEAGATSWELDIDTAEVPDAPMVVRSVGFEVAVRD